MRDRGLVEPQSFSAKSHSAPFNIITLLLSGYSRSQQTITPSIISSKKQTQNSEPCSKQRFREKSHVRSIILLQISLRLSIATAKLLGCSFPLMKIVPYHVVAKNSFAARCLLQRPHHSLFVCSICQSRRLLLKHINSNPVPLSSHL